MRNARLVAPLAALLALVPACGSAPSGTSCLDPSFTLCSTACFDLQNDRFHCGTCATACTGTQSCVAGTCTSTDAGPRDAYVTPPHDASRPPDAFRPDAWTPPVVGTCQSCAAATCVTGDRCAFRRCDGLPLCYDSTNSCAGCPTVSDFEPGCGSSADCGPNSVCARLSTDFGLGCLHRCTTAADCTSVPTGFDDRGQTCVGGRCMMACDPVAAPTCPFTLICRSDQTCGF